MRSVFERVGDPLLIGAVVGEQGLNLVQQGGIAGAGCVKDARPVLRAQIHYFQEQILNALPACDHGLVITPYLAAFLPCEAPTES